MKKFSGPNRARRFILILSVVTAFVFCVWALYPRRSDPVLGHDPLPAVFAVENHSEALAHWAEKGYRDATLLHIDTHDDIRLISDEKLEILEKLYEHKDLVAIRQADSPAETGLFNIGNFVYAAARLGIVREVYWVAPFPFLSDQEALSSLRQYLSAASFEPADIVTFHPVNGCFAGSMHGIPLTICGLGHLPDLDRPLLLSIDADFFPYAATVDNQPLTNVVRAGLLALREKRYRIADAVVAASLEGSFVLAQEAWVSDMLAEALENPAEIDGEPPPRLWVLRQQAADNRKQGWFSATDKLLEQAPQDLRDEPSLTLYLADALLNLGEFDQSLRLAEQSCQSRPLYCYGLPELGLQLLEAGNLPQAERFFDAGEDLRRGMDYGQLGYAIALQRSEHYAKALRVLTIIREMSGAFPADFLAGRIYLLCGDEASAIAAYERASRAVEQDLYLNIAFPEIGAAIRSAVTLYERRGRAGDAEKLRRNPLLKEVFVEPALGSPRAR